MQALMKKKDPKQLSGGILQKTYSSDFTVCNYNLWEFEKVIPWTKGYFTLGS
jgi:hypothetical protein